MAAGEPGHIAVFHEERCSCIEFYHLFWQQREWERAQLIVRDDYDLPRLGPGIPYGYQKFSVEVVGGSDIVGWNIAQHIGIGCQGFPNRTDLLSHPRTRAFDHVETDPVSTGDGPEVGPVARHVDGDQGFVVTAVIDGVAGRTNWA